MESRLKQRARAQGDVATQIAAPALAEDVVLVTRNRRHFEGTPGLDLKDWLD